MLIACVGPSALGAERDRFRDGVEPILRAHCVRCHGGEKPRGDVDLSTAAGAFEEGIVIPGKPDESRLIEVISGDKPSMPQSGDRLGPAQVAELRAWVAEGARWPEGLTLKYDPLNWWSLRPLVRPPVPSDHPGARNPIDAFIRAGLSERGLSPSPEADRRTLIRRVTFDLIGLPPTPEEVSAFLAAPAPDAYERLVDRLLASPQHGERWARHWLDVARYGDTHGYDKDQPRPNAWPYRDYVIRALNEDRPYGRFVEEQVAGDVLYPGSRDGIEALGFLAAGPWDLIGHAEVPETKLDGQLARLLDRDDMVSNTLNTFASLTVQCARCHDHKFDPVSQEDYYSLQAVFAAIDRADRLYDVDPNVARERSGLMARRSSLTGEIAALGNAARARAGTPLAALDARIDEAGKRKPPAKPEAFGYHSAISTTADAIRWVQVDLGRPTAIRRVVLHASDDDFNGIGAGFGFPVRYRVEAADDPSFGSIVTTLADRSGSDQANPGLEPVAIEADATTARYLRITTTRLAPRKDDYHLALAEVEVWNSDGTNVAREAQVSALDSIEAPVRWRKTNLVDGLYPTGPAEDITALKRRRDALIRDALEPGSREALDRANQSLSEIDARFAGLPAQARAYVGSVHHGSGLFRGTGPDGGRPREIRVLRRGDLRSPAQVVGPGTVALVEGIPARFDLPPGAPEGERRAALARWLSDRRNPLTWRSIVNRVWQYHFGRGLVDTPNDFGRMGARPTHPELLDWLASDFRDGRQSLKALHRLIVTSATYRQSSDSDELKARIDADNAGLWRMNRRRLEAEAVRDSVLAVAGRLDALMGGPGFRDFVVDRPEHSPHYQYDRFDVEDPRAHRRAIYRTIVRSQPQPFLAALDCADPSMSVDRRNQSITALQALALNDRLMVAMAGHLAGRLEREAADTPARVERAFRLALARPPDAAERAALVELADRSGLANACRLLFNLNEFVFVD